MGNWYHAFPSELQASVFSALDSSPVYQSSDFLSQLLFEPSLLPKDYFLFIIWPPMSLIPSFDSLYPQNIYLIVRSSWSCMMGKISSKAPSEPLISETSIWGPLATFGPPPPGPPGPWKDAYTLEMGETSDPVLCPASGGEDAMVCMVQSPGFSFKLVFLVQFQTSVCHWSIFAISLFCDTGLNAVQSYLSSLSAATA